MTRRPPKPPKARADAVMRRDAEIGRGVRRLLTGLALGLLERPMRPANLVPSEDAQKLPAYMLASVAEWGTSTPRMVLWERTTVDGAAVEYHPIGLVVEQDGRVRIRYQHPDGQLQVTPPQRDVLEAVADAVEGRGLVVRPYTIGAVRGEPADTMIAWDDLVMIPKSSPGGAVIFEHRRKTANSS